MDSKDKAISDVFKDAGYIFPDGQKVNSTMKLTVDERLFIALNRIYNIDKEQNGISRARLAGIFGLHAPYITITAKGDKNLKEVLAVFRYMFKRVGLPYKDLDAPEPNKYHKDLPPTLRNYKKENGI